MPRNPRIHERPAEGRRYRLHSRATRRLTSIAFGIAAFVTLPIVVRAQSITSVTPGVRVRIDLPPADRVRWRRDHAQSVVGTLEATQGDTVMLSVSAGQPPVRVPVASIHTAYVSHGSPPRWQAALTGAVAPALIASALTAASMSIHRGRGDPSIGAAAASSAAWAGASGALVSAWIPKERWQRVSVVAPVEAIP
jgi:hypothetical protein